MKVYGVYLAVLHEGQELRGLFRTIHSAVEVATGIMKDEAPRSAWQDIDTSEKIPFSKCTYDFHVYIEELQVND